MQYERCANAAQRQRNHSATVSLFFPFSIILISIQNMLLVRVMR
jgi:hypothetical protein